MIKRGTPRKPVKFEYILEKIDEYDIYRFYLGVDIKIGKNISSPFRADKHPSFHINVTASGHIYHLDFADESKKGNCLKLVQQLYGVSYRDALYKIDNDFGLGLWSEKKSDYKRIIQEYKKPKELKPSPKAKIEVTPRNYTVDELRYWNEYHIDKSEIKEDHIYSIQSLYINDKLISSNELRFAYWYESGWKIYTPFASKKAFKWVSNIPIDLMDGLKDLVPGKRAIITKAKKDKLVWRKFVKNTASTQNESKQAINPTNIEFFQNNFESTIVNFDPDPTGVESCKYYNQFGFGYINTPKSYVEMGVKDLAQMSRDLCLNEVEKFLKSKNII
jgi:hypothetical protein